MNNDDEQTTDPHQLVGWFEFGCWTIIAMTPFLYWVNGSAVSRDQLVVRSLLVAVALIAGVTLRCIAWSRR
ncbi:hypothetical protein [Novipirellula rosea]|uniref:Uncharacterized protein n=1 Tax=Novipirellula rosea TaxID=1031540 RepID=A0ABP8MKP5_9BACT